MYDYQTADPALYARLKEFARRNRQYATEAESVMWHYLCGGSLGVKFKRQHIIGPFIADFACIEKGLVIEIDGGYHSLPEQEVSDEQRTRWLNAHGFDVLRFSNEEIICDIDHVIGSVKDYMDY